MRDIGFTPDRDVETDAAVRNVIRGSIDGGFRNPPVRWLMLAIPFTAGTGIYLFYASQPYLLELYGDPTAYSIAGLAAAIFAGVQIAAGLMVSWFGAHLPAPDRCAPRRRGASASCCSCCSACSPRLRGGARAAGRLVVRDRCHAPDATAYLNGVIPSEQRATVLSFDSLMGCAGGVVAQPVLGRVADVSGYAASYLVRGRHPGAGAAVRAAGAPHASARSDPITAESD